MKQDDRYWSTPQVAARWGVDGKYVVTRIREGEIPAIRLGHKSYRILQSDLEKYENRLRVQADKKRRVAPKQVTR